MLIRLLQSFDKIDLDMNAQPKETQPPESWKSVPGRQSIERIFPKTHISMYSYVSRPAYASVAEEDGD